uniref:C-type lectin domain-containing protein n=1 Tax=Salmo trutta TaxID=8032 RepID=A0A673ZYK7_SALTR
MKYYQKTVTMAIMPILLLSGAFALGDANPGLQMFEEIDAMDGEQGLYQEGRSACPSGWSKYRSHCFRYISTERTWAEFEQFFVYQGDNLASVHSLWLCSDGSRFDFTNWSKGQPDIYEGKQNCLYFNYGAEKPTFCTSEGIKTFTPTLSCGNRTGESAISQACTHKLTRTHIKQNK